MQSVPFSQGHYIAMAQITTVSPYTITRQNPYKAAFLVIGAWHEQNFFFFLTAKE